MESINNVEKTLVHIGHLHPLNLVASPEPKPMCHACNMPCAEQSYGCVYCYCFFHVTCATPGRRVDHPSHPAHSLNLELTPPYPNGSYNCDACGIDGTTFCLRCRECSYDLHLHCAAVPHKINHRSHRHPLALEYKNPNPPGGGAFCDLCKKYLDADKWFYLCRKCDFGGHIGCFYERREVLSPGLQAPPQQPQQHFSPQPSQPQRNGAAMAAASQRNALLRAQMQLAQAQSFANVMSNAGQDIQSLFYDKVIYKYT